MKKLFALINTEGKTKEQLKKELVVAYEKYVKSANPYSNYRGFIGGWNEDKEADNQQDNAQKRP